MSSRISGNGVRTSSIQLHTTCYILIAMVPMAPDGCPECRDGALWNRCVIKRILHICSQIVGAHSLQDTRDGVGT